MKISFHIGAHCTDDERLVRSLLRNRDRLAEAGVAVPGPAEYRPILRDVVNGLRGKPATTAAQDDVLRAILGDDAPETLVLSNQSFISVPERAFDEGQLYPRMFKALWLRNIFPDHDVSFHICLRDPATMIPELYQRIGGERDFATFLDGTDPRELRWSAPMEVLREVCPDCPITVWCYEDTPLVWEEVMRAVGHVGPDVTLHGTFDMARTIITQDGMARLRAYVARHPPATPALRHRVVTAFIDKFGVAEELEQDVSLPGWTGELMAEMTEAYEADLVHVARMPGVRIVARD